MKILIAFLFAFLFFASCTKPIEKRLPSKEGIWDFTLTSKESSSSGTVINNSTIGGKITFRSNNTGVLTVNGGSNPVELKYTATDQGVTLEITGTSFLYFTVTNTKNEIELKRTETQGGFTLEEVWKFTR